MKKEGWSPDQPSEVSLKYWENMKDNKTDKGTIIVINENKKLTRQKEKHEIRYKNMAMEVTDNKCEV